jgi:serine/threonine-protein kinase
MNQQLIENRYKIIQPLGSGGFGETFLAEDAHMPSGRRCVIKRLKPVTNDPKVYQLVQERFSREAAILEDLGANHAQIPTLYAYFESENLFYLVQEWIQGETLTAKVQQSSKLSESSVKAILVEILPVLEYVHSKGIVHRDIKPDNILLRQADAKPVLIDFGAVKETMGTVMSNSGNESRSIVIGTPGFMPSEQAVGRPVFASDLYSLGLTAIYLLAGKSPQDLTTDPTTGEILWRQFAPTVTPTLAGILDKAIHPSARDRYHSARAMLDDLQRGQVPIAPGVVPPSIPPTVRSEAPPVAPVYPPPTYPTYPPPPAPTVVSGTPGVAIAKGLADWQKAVITGGIIGLFVVGAIFATRSPVTPVADETETSEATGSSSDNTTTTSSPDSSNVVESNQSSTSQSSVQEQPYNPPVQNPRLKSLGWIRIGAVDLNVSHANIGAPLIPTTQKVTISPPLIPKIGDRVIISNNVNLRVNYPQPPYYKLAQDISVLPVGQEIFIQDLVTFVDTTTSSSYPVIWAKVAVP